MTIRFACPTCKSALEAAEDTVGSKSSCPKCGQRVQVPDPRRDETLMGVLPSDWLSQPVPKARDREEVFPIAQPAPLLPETQPSPNILQRYIAWSGMRSAIFQALLLGWTAFVGLGTCGIVFNSIRERRDERNVSPNWPRQPEDRTIQAEGLMWGMCCSCGVYLLIALPLGIAAIATLNEGWARGQRSPP